MEKIELSKPEIEVANAAMELYIRRAEDWLRRKVYPKFTDKDRVVVNLQLAREVQKKLVY